MKTTLKELVKHGICYNVDLGVWVDHEGNTYRLNTKTIMEDIEFEIISGDEYEHTVALDSLTDDRHGS